MHHSTDHSHSLLSRTLEIVEKAIKLSTVSGRNFSHDVAILYVGVTTCGITLRWSDQDQKQYQETPLYKPAPRKSVLCRSSIASAPAGQSLVPIIIIDVRVQLLGKVADITEDLCVTVSGDVRVTKFLDFHAVRRDGRINAVDNHGVSITRQVNDQLMSSVELRPVTSTLVTLPVCARDHYWCAAVNGVAEYTCRIFE